MCSIKHSGKLATATALLLWWKWLEFRGEKTFHNIKCPLFSYSFSFDPSLLWPLLLIMAALKGYAQFHTLCQASRIT